MRLILLLLPFALTLSAENWPQWRGPTADGHSSETGLPASWSATENVLWKTPLPGLGTSTPIIWGDKIFVTSQLGIGPSAGGNDFDEARIAKAGAPANGVTFIVAAFARNDGTQLWQQEFPASDSLPAVHIKHNLASPSCVTDGERVYAWFGDGLAVAMTVDGELLWTRRLADEENGFNVKWGHGSSATLYEDSLLLLVDHPGHAYLLAVDPVTGEDIWRKNREETSRSYTTPFVIRHDGSDQLVINTSNYVEAVDPTNGDSIWRVGEPNRVPVSTPVFHDGILYSGRGHNSGPFLAVRVDGEGDVSDSKMKWRVGTGAPYISSFVLDQGVIFMATERGIASAIDAETGEMLWRQRLGGAFSASPIVADGKIYFTQETGKVFVIEASRQYTLLNENAIDERTLASPAVSNGTIFLRTDDNLWAIGPR